MDEVMDSRPKLQGPKRLLKTDWADEERAWRSGLSQFHDDIAIANVACDIQEVNEEANKTSGAQPIGDKKVAQIEPKTCEKNPNIVQENIAGFVESSSVGKPNCGDSTTRPAQPKEQDLTDDIFGEDTPSVVVKTESPKNEPPSKTKEPVASKAAPAPASSSDDIFNDDFFGDSSTKAPWEDSEPPKALPKQEQTAAKPTTAEMNAAFAEVEKHDCKVETVVFRDAEALGKFKESLKDFKETIETIKSEPEAAPPIQHAPEGMGMGPVKTRFTDEELKAKGIDVDKFKDMMNVIELLLFKLPEVDLYRLADSIGGYGVNIDFDKERDNIKALAMRMGELETKRDSLHGHLMKLKPNNEGYKEAVDWVSKVGPSMSSGKNAEARTAEIRMLTQEIYLRSALLERVYKSYEDTYSHIGRQIDTISRLVTIDQNMIRRAELKRGMAPYEEQAWEEPTPREKHVPKVLSSSSPEETEIGGSTDDELTGMNMSQPLDPKKYKDLQDFPKDASKLAAKGGRTFQKGDMAW